MLRRRERRVWSDTPLARIFTAKSEWHLLHVKALIQQMSSALLQRKAAARDLFVRFGETKTGESGESAMREDEKCQELTLGLAGLQRLCVTLRLGFSPADIASMASAADTSGDGRMTVPQFAKFFGVPEELSEQARNTSATGAAVNEEDWKPQTWDCAQCGHQNPAYEIMCEMCGFGWSGRREVPPDKWACDTCSFFNPKSQYYCDMCNSARPDLSTVRF